MACPLSRILNPINSSSQAIVTPSNAASVVSDPVSCNSQTTAAHSAASSAASAADDDDIFGPLAPRKRQRSSSNTEPSTSQWATRSIVIPSVILSPQKGSLYNRRASTSPIRVPILSSPPKRDKASYLSIRGPPTLETDFNRFNVFQSLLTYPELTLEVSRHLGIEELISLYAISKEYHGLANARFTALILAQSVGKASESSRVFVFRCYKNLCMRDPASRKNEVRAGEIRWVPSFRWLRMILFRERVVDDILKSLIMEGHRMPQRASLVLKKLWFTLDIADNARRIGLMHNSKFWSSKDLFVATMFFLKLDMRLTDPVIGNAEIRLRRMLLNQRSLSTLSKVLKREEMLSQLDMLRMIVRYNYRPRNQRGHRILGVPAAEIGKLQYEGWGISNVKFIPIDQLVMREAVRRKLNLQTHYIDMMIYGYINKRTFEDIRTPMVKHVAEGDQGGEESESESESESNGKSEGERPGREFFASDSEVEKGEDGKDVVKEREQHGGEEELDYDAYGMNSARNDGQG